MAWVRGCKSFESASRTAGVLRGLGYKLKLSGITLTVYATPYGKTNKAASVESLKSLKCQTK